MQSTHCILQDGPCKLQGGLTRSTFYNLVRSCAISRDPQTRLRVRTISPGPRQITVTSTAAAGHNYCSVGKKAGGKLLRPPPGWRPMARSPTGTSSGPSRLLWSKTAHRGVAHRQNPFIVTPRPESWPSILTHLLPRCWRYLRHCSAGILPWHVLFRWRRLNERKSGYSRL